MHYFVLVANHLNIRLNKRAVQSRSLPLSTYDTRLSEMKCKKKKKDPTSSQRLFKRHVPT